jgi:CRP-like cAMP-binding protein
MTQGNYIQLYSTGSRPEAAYLLGDGTVYFFSSDTDKYAVKGKNLIVGAAELILNSAGGMDTGRMETAVMDPSTAIKKIPADKFIESLKSYSFILNACMVMAKQVALTNEIINRNTNSLQGDEKKLKELSVEYYRIVTALKAEYNKRKLPFIKDVFTKYEASLVFKRGEAFGRSLEPERAASAAPALKGRYRDIAPGETICQEGTMGDEMYVLHSGTIDIVIGGNRVASIAEQGAIIGEMALLLGEKRTATLKARNNVVITGISKSDLKEISEKDGSLFLTIAVSLAKKHYFNIEKIHSVNGMIIERELEGRRDDEAKRMMEMNKAKNELSSLKNDISKLVDSKGADYLQCLV